MAKHWILDLTKELQLPHTPPDQKLSPKSIYRVPKILTDVNDQAYKPKLASFGPYHHDCRHLRPMEHHKHRALIQFLRRIAKASKTPEDVYFTFKKVEPRRRGRPPSPRNWLKEKDDFLKLMIVDGCFALEVMLAEKRSAAGEQSEYDSHDPMSGVERMNYVVPDLKQICFSMKTNSLF